jgi:hypothetical protein
VESQPHPGLVQDGHNIFVDDLAPDPGESRSDGWVTDEDDSPTLPSRGDGPSIQIPRCPVRFAHLDSPESNSGTSSPPVLQEELESAISELTTILEVLLLPLGHTLFPLEELGYFQDLILQVLVVFSEHGLMDCAFRSDPTGFTRQQSLLWLRNILGHYYPSVHATEIDQVPMGLHNPVVPTPTSSAPIRDPDLSFRLQATLPLQEPPSAAPALTTSQAWRCHQAKAKLTATTLAEFS